MTDLERATSELNTAIYQTGINGGDFVQITYETARSVANLMADMVHSVGDPNRTIEKLELQIADYKGE